MRDPYLDQVILAHCGQQSVSQGMTLDNGDLIIVSGDLHVGVIDRGQNASLRDCPHIQRPVIESAVEPGLIEIVPGHVH